MSSAIDEINNNISYAKWKERAVRNRVWYFEITNTSPTSYVAAFGKLGVITTTIITESSDVSDFETTFKPIAFSTVSETELVELSRADAAIGKIDGRQQKAFQFSDNVIYIGYAPIGSLESENVWTIRKMDLDSNGNPITERWTAVGSAVWTNRTSETYD